MSCRRKLFLKLTADGAFINREKKVGDKTRSKSNVHSACRKMLLCCSCFCIVCLRVWNRCLLTPLRKHPQRGFLFAPSRNQTRDLPHGKGRSKEKERKRERMV